jgi:hypothetical protein
MPRLYQLAFQDPSFQPALFWKVRITAACPWCGADMVLGDREGGGAMVMCSVCAHQTPIRASADDIAAAVLDKVGKK